MFTGFFSSLVLAQLAVAQYGGGPATTATSLAPAPSAPPDTQGQHNIDVFPNGQYIFKPSNITAQIGDLVTFYFPNADFPHSVTQSNFAQPCTYLEASGNSSAGFDSGLQLATTFTLNVTSMDPIWFHCKQLGHCGMGMVGSINAPLNGSNTYDAFVAAAKAIGPVNEATQTTGGPVLTGVGAFATAAPGNGALKTAAKSSLCLVTAGLLFILI